MRGDFTKNELDQHILKIKYINLTKYDKIIGNIQYYLKNQFGHKTFPNIKYITAKVITLDRNIYANIFPPIGYTVTNKTDGIHGLLIEYDNGFCLINDEKVMHDCSTGSVVRIYEVEIFEDESFGQSNYVVILDILNNHDTWTRMREIRSNFDELREKYMKQQ
jgi:hypothetical protein